MNVRLHTENIVHIVLARLPDAPKGTKGISLFIVPKFVVDAEGNPAESNHVNCGSIEHKMGIHGNATCVLNFDGAKGYLIGPPNKGLACMFTFMNSARIGTGIQGLAHAELAYQNSLAYAKDRLQMRSLSGPKAPDKAADPIIVHPDVRRMLLTQKAFSEGGRAMVYYAGKLLDLSHFGSEEEKTQAEKMLSFLTPIIKAFLTETGFEAANQGLQCLGGHGYIAEWGMEQNVRDARIALLYEGTSGIQALDLLGRKIAGDQCAVMNIFCQEIVAFCQSCDNSEEMNEFTTPLLTAIQQWRELAKSTLSAAMKNPEEIGAAAFDFLMYSGYVVMAYMWCKAAATAQQKLAEGSGHKELYDSKLSTARFYFQRILPRIRSHATAIAAGVDTLMELDEDSFIF